MSVKVLLLGNGAREHAIAEAIRRSPQKTLLVSYMRSLNPGIASLSDGIVLGRYDDILSIKKFASSQNPDFAIIGPEEPLSYGVVDALETINVPSVGPKKILAQLETSKAFTRQIMEKYKIKGSPRFKIFSNIEGIIEYLLSLKGFVIKPDGLTGGKGVKVQGEHLHTINEALDYCKQILKTHSSVVIEEKLEGEEFSLQCLTDGRTVIATPPVQDHKRAYEDDQGPNTGGMGSYSCENHQLPFLTQRDVEEGLKITKRVARALHKETGELYKGIMYAGLMATKEGVKLIEYNARFGDPEVMNTLPILKTDFIELCNAIIEGNLKLKDIVFENKATVCKYVVPQGYPDNPVSNQKIEINQMPSSAKMYHSSVEKRHDGVYMSSSRAIALVGIADNIDDAERFAEEAVNSVKGPVFHRRDIGTRKLLEKRVSHMKRILE